LLLLTAGLVRLRLLRWLLRVLRWRGAIAVAAVTARFGSGNVARRLIFRRRRFGRRTLRFLSGRTTFGHGVTAVFIAFVFGHGQTSWAPLW
jgi:hypothetical protein